MGPCNARALEMALFGYAWTRPGILPCLAVILSPLQLCHCRGVRCQGAEWILRKLASLKHEWPLLLLCQRAEPSWVGGQGELAGGAGNSIILWGLWPNPGLVLLFRKSELVWEAQELSFAEQRTRCTAWGTLITGLSGAWCLHRGAERGLQLVRFVKMYMFGKRMKSRNWAANQLRTLLCLFSLWVLHFLGT